MRPGRGRARLACDRCKTDACRPAPEAVLPAAIDVLAGDPSARVRTYAAELVGRWVHSRPAAREAITRDAAPVTGGAQEGILVRARRADLPAQAAAAGLARPG